MKNVHSLDDKKQAQVQWLQDPNQSNLDHLNNVRCEASRHFRNKNKEYRKTKIDEFESNKNIKNLKNFIRTSIALRSVTRLKLI
jgi:hypothetical protein